MSKPNIGDEVNDKVTAFGGIIVATTYWLNGCERCMIQPPGLDADGNIKPLDSIDSVQLDVVKAGAVPVRRPLENTGLKLGDKVRDLVTNIEGVAVAKTVWLNGLVRWVVQRRDLDKSGKIRDSVSVDDAQLVLIPAQGVTPPESAKKGPAGPRPDPTGLPSAKR